MSSTTLRREGDTVYLEHKYYGKFKFREVAALADAAAASALVFAGERTDGCAARTRTPAPPRAAAADSPHRSGEPKRVAVKFDNGNQARRGRLSRSVPLCSLR